MSVSYEEISIEIKTHFTRRIKNVDPHFRFTVLSLKLYDCSADPREHVLRYHRSMVPLKFSKIKKRS